MEKLTRIEKFDQQFPGLEDSVRDWFAQGITSEKVKDLLREKYGLAVGKWDVSYFRTVRWARELAQAREKRIAVLAAQMTEEREAFRRGRRPNQASKAAARGAR